MAGSGPEHDLSSNTKAQAPAPPQVFVLCGPTGVGKTEVAVALARKHSLHLVSADSRQVYSWLDIGTAKPGPDLRKEIGIYMVDMVEPSRSYSAADYARDALAVMRRLEREGRRFIVVGGSGLYLRALFEPLFDAPRPGPELRRRLESLSAAESFEQLRRVDPERAAQLHPNDRQRIMRALEIFELTGKTTRELARTQKPVAEYVPAYAVLTMKREDMNRQIDSRFDAMMAAGLLDEVKELKQAGFGRSSYVANAYGYAELLACLDGELTLEAAVAQAKAKTRAYAKRQLTWFRGLKDARWFEHTDVETTARRLEPLLLEVLGPGA